MARKTSPHSAARGALLHGQGASEMIPGAVAAVLVSLVTAPHFRDLTPEQQGQVSLRLARRSMEIARSPFATMSSFELHGPDEDAGVIEAMAGLGVKTVVMHNIHMCLPDARDPRLNAWLTGCAREGIEVRCILVSGDPEFWRVALTNYGDRIRHWSYNNEPNAPGADNDHSHPRVMPQQYVANLRAIRAVMDEVRPECRLWGPETAMLQCMEETPWPWFRLACEAGLLDLVDGVTVHPYRQGYSPANTPEKPSTFEGRPTDRYASYEEQIGTLRALVRDQPIAVTEVGWSTTPKGPISELTQAKFALRQQIQDFSLGIRPAVWFVLRERRPGQPFEEGHIENSFGVIRPDNSPKPAYVALRTLYSQLDDECLRAFPRVEWSRPDVKWYVFDDFSGAVPARKVLYWLPVAAKDDCPVEQVSLTIGDASVPALPVSDAPRLLRLHRLEGAWGWPVLIDLVEGTADDAVDWERTAGQGG